jgi:hypothetical protein
MKRRVHLFTVIVFILGMLFTVINTLLFLEENTGLATCEYCKKCPDPTQEDHNQEDDDCTLFCLLPSDPEFPVINTYNNFLPYSFTSLKEASLPIYTPPPKS